MMGVSSIFNARRVTWVAGTLALLVGTVFALHDSPILFHIFAETNCACGEYHEEVTGVTVRNPFRDRSPERSAEGFLEDLRNGRCTVDVMLCRYALEGHRVSDWRLANRRDRTDGVQLYYTLTKFAEPDPKYRLTGEGLIEVVRTEGRWTVTNYSSYF
jgi:hypothetical protein